jgi:hypothetical protein
VHASRAVFQAIDEARIFGRIAQRESVPFTRERSKVRSLVRPPFYLTTSEGYRSVD